ncbi:MAG: hypothetical protein KJ061_10635 [Vicinamibacteraceae bacterium]|nr:hypothetical protein [Vicinamibacteraceae bacterium]
MKPWARKPCAVAAIVLATAAMPACRRAMPALGADASRWDLIDHLTDASFNTGASPIRDTYGLRHATIRGREHRCLQAVPPSRLTIGVDVPDAARLTGMVTLHPDVWEMPGDGVDFRIEVLDGDRRAVVYGRSVYPYHYPADRRPMSVNVDLAEYAGRRVTLVFITGPGPTGNAVYDAALWCGMGIPRALGGTTDAGGR